MSDEKSDDDGRSAEGEGDRRDRPPAPHRPGFEDRFWLVLLALIVVALFVAGFLSDAGSAGPDGYTGWH
ncbi:hypothetical protein ACFZDG_26580 [Kitasatospora xanthocidica]|uniref:hypothetical protein n=1 Tax=Kitasatospora xanthocidica TaxID=83382 RepID=UPI0036E8AED3